MVSFFTCISDLKYASVADRIPILATCLADLDPTDAGLALGLLSGEGSALKLTPRRAAVIAEQYLDEYTYRAAKAAGADALETLCLLVPQGQGNGAALGQLPELRISARNLSDTAILEMLQKIPLEERPGLVEMLAGRAAVLLSTREIWQALAQAFHMPLDDIAKGWFVDAPPFGHIVNWLHGHGAAPHGHGFLWPGVVQDVEQIDADTPLWQSREEDWIYFQARKGERVQIVTGPGAMIVNAAGKRLTSAFPELAAKFASFEPALVEGVIYDEQGALNDRLRRARPSRRLVAENPVRVEVFDLLATAETNLNEQPYGERLKKLDQWMVRHSSPFITVPDWGSGTPPAVSGLQVRAAAEQQQIWQTTDRVAIATAPIIYVKMGHAGQISSLVLGIRLDGVLAPLGEVQPKLSSDEEKLLVEWTRKRATERFGPVHAVPPEKHVVFSYREVVESKRRKIGFKLNGMLLVSLASGNSGAVPDFGDQEDLLKKVRSSGD